MVVYLLNHHFKGYLGVCMCQQSYMNTKDGVGKLQMLNIDASHGDAGIRRSVDFYLTYLIGISRRSIFV